MKTGIGNDTCCSICIACYNGEAYIKEQLDSILSQINRNDEIIIIDDCSIDNTGQVIKSYSDPRIHYYCNERNTGVNGSFERALRMANGEYIFMSDQDDVWTDRRYEIMLAALKSSQALCASGNSVAIDKNGSLLNFDLGSLKASESDNYIGNILDIFLGKAYYYGCAMAFRNELKNYILPFPQSIESHDLWIAMMANVLRRNTHVEDIVLERRIHGKNASVIKRSLFKKIKSRFIFLASLCEAVRRVRQVPKRG